MKITTFKMRGKVFIPFKKVSQNYATEIKLRAERKVGEILKETIQHEGGRPPIEKPLLGGKGFLLSYLFIK